MSILKKLLLFMTLTLAGTPSAFAGLWTQLGLAYTRSSEQVGSGESATVSRIFGTGTLGLRFAEGFFLGGQSLYSKSVGSGSGRTWGVGPKGGVMLGPLELTAAYLPMVRDSGASAGTRKGSGYAVNLGWGWRVGVKGRVGLMLTYWSVTLTEENGQPLSSRPKLTTLSPLATVGLEF